VCIVHAAQIPIQQRPVRADRIVDDAHRPVDGLGKAYGMQRLGLVDDLSQRAFEALLIERSANIEVFGRVNVGRGHRVSLRSFPEIELRRGKRQFPD
jgi:hypothetical protein